MIFGTVPSRLLLAAPLAGLLGCMESATRPDSPAEQPEGSPRASSVLQEIVTPSEHVHTDAGTGRLYFRDPVTGESFLLNPNRTKLGEDGRGLAKASADRLGSWTDASGTVEVTVYQAIAPAVKDNAKGCHIASVAVQVDPDRVVVGGGANATAQGAFITKSYPVDMSLTTWAAQSKDHGPLMPHDLVVYAVGLRLKGTNGAWLPANTLRQHLQLRSLSANGWNTLVTAQNSVEYHTIGGGANIQWTTKGQLLTDNRPDETRPGWMARSKSHRSEEYCPLTVYAIGISKAFIPGFGTLDPLRSASGAFVKSSGTYGSGYVSNSLNSTWGYAVTSVGGMSTSTNGAGRLLQRMGYYYDNSGTLVGSVATKDHFVASAGTTYTYLTGLRRL